MEFIMSEQFVSGYINQLKHSDRVALDIGANIGIYTLPMADKFKKVYAFEPHPDNQQALQANLDKFGKTNVEIVPKCVSDRSGTILLNTNPHNIGGHTINSRVATHQEWGFVESKQIEVPAVTLDEFCKDLDVEFMKVDIEGAEDFIFEGAKEVLSRPRLNIMIEVHNEVNRPKLFKLFQDAGFKIGSLGIIMGNGQMIQGLVNVNQFDADHHYLLQKE